MTAKLPDEVEAGILEIAAKHYEEWGDNELHPDQWQTTRHWRDIQTALKAAAVVAVEHAEADWLNRRKNLWKVIEKLQAELAQLRRPMADIEEHVEAAYMQYCTSGNPLLRDAIRPHMQRAVTEAVAAERADQGRINKEWDGIIEANRKAERERHAAELASLRAGHQKTMAEYFKKDSQIRAAALEEAEWLVMGWIAYGDHIEGIAKEIRQLAAVEKPEPDVERCPECGKQCHYDEGDRDVGLYPCWVCECGWFSTRGEVAKVEAEMQDHHRHSQYIVSPYLCATPPRQEGKLHRNCGGTVTR